MKCPRHHAELVSIPKGKRSVERCPECGGLWIPGEAIDVLLGSGEKLKLRSLCSARKSDLLCPVDRKVLGEGTIAGVTLDFCLECNGLWLDWGELETLQRRIRSERKPLGEGRKMIEKSGSGWDGVSDGLAVVDLVFNGILALVALLGP